MGVRAWCNMVAGSAFGCVMAVSMPDAAFADRVRWTVQSAFGRDVGSIAWDLEARVAEMTNGEMRLKAFVPGDLATPDQAFRAVSIGAVNAAVLPPELVPFDLAPAPGPVGNYPEVLHWLTEQGRETLRRLAVGGGVDLMPCGLAPGAKPLFLAVHLPDYRHLERAQKMILEAACDGITLDRLTTAWTPPD